MASDSFKYTHLPESPKSLALSPLPHSEVQQSSVTLPKETKEKMTSSRSPQSRNLRCMKGKPSLSLKVKTGSSFSVHSQLGKVLSFYFSV